MKKAFRMTVLAAICFLFAATATSPVTTLAAENEAITVTYDNLRQLLVQGNLSLQKQNDNYYTNKETYEKMYTQLKEEQENMRFLAKQYEDDTEAASVYSGNAKALSSSAEQIAKRLAQLNSQSNQITVEKNEDTFLISAQSLLNSYNQMADNVTAKTKSVEAAQVSYQAAIRQQGTGTITAADVLAAADSLKQQQNQLASYEQQASQLRFSLLSMLGLGDGENVTIGTLPEPDLNSINSIDYESDRTQAVNNNNGVKNARRGNASTEGEIQRKESAEAEAVGTAEAQFLATYQSLQASKLLYEAKQASYESALLNYQSLQRKKQAGTIDQTAYLQGEATYLEALAARNTASMNLLQAYDTYKWELKGL